MLYKPRGFVTTMADEQGRRCVADLVQDVPERVYPIGRLDRDSEGLLLLTDDGELANGLTHPKYHIPKVYRVTVRPDFTEEQAVALLEGVELDGERCAPVPTRVITKEPNRAVIELVLHEGKNRQIRRMCDQLGLEVARLRRVAVGPVRLGMLQPGKWRDLEKSEIEALRRELDKSIARAEQGVQPEPYQWQESAPVDDRDTPEEPERRPQPERKAYTPRPQGERRPYQGSRPQGDRPAFSGDRKPSDGAPKKD